jgi:hypothetical protein
MSPQANVSGIMAIQGMRTGCELNHQVHLFLDLQGQVGRASAGQSPLSSQAVDKPLQKEARDVTRMQPWHELLLCHVAPLSFRPC